MACKYFIFLISALLTSLFSESLSFDLNDYTFSPDSLNITYKEKTYKSFTFGGVKIPVTYHELRFSGQYATDIQIVSYDSVLIDPDMGISYFDQDTLFLGNKFPRKPANVGARGVKRYGGFSVLELNPFFIRNDSLFFITSLEYQPVNFRKFSDTVKSQIYEKIDMVIITSDELKDNFEPYKMFKSRQGLKTIIKSVAEIYSEYPGDNDVMKIRNYIRDKYVSNDIEYVLIGGGYSIVPVGTAYPFDSAYTSYIRTDSFYSRLDGDPDSDGNGIYFQISDNSDHYEDVYVGRFPGNTESEIDAIINKTIAYYSPDRSYREGFNSSVFLLGMDVFSAGDGRKWCNNVRTEFPPHFSIDSLYEGVSSGFGRDSILSALKAGYNFFYSQSHGDYHVIRQRNSLFKIWSDDILNLGGVSGLYYVAACEPGNISTDSFSRKAMINPDGGCVTYVGSAAEEFPSTTDNFNAYFFRQINRGRTYGQSLADAKIVYGNLSSGGYSLYMSHTYSIQGDPSNLPFTGVPQNIALTVSQPFRKGNGSAAAAFSVDPADTMFVTMTEGGRILAAVKTPAKDFIISYEGVTSDSVYLHFYSQSSFFTTNGYSTSPADEISFSITNMAVQDANYSKIVEHGESFGMNFRLDLNSNPAGIDSLVAVVTGTDHSGVNIINGQKRFRLPAAGSYANIGAFSMNFISSDPLAGDSVAVADFHIRKKDGTVLYSDKVRVPVSVPYLKLESYELKNNSLKPKLINKRKGLINTARIDIYEIIRSSIQVDELRTDDKSSVTLKNITGFKIVTDSVSFTVDPAKKYKLGITVNGGYVYYSDEFGFSDRTGQNMILYADNSPGYINLEWTNPFLDTGGVNVYTSASVSFADPVLKNFERVNGSKFSFSYAGQDPVYIQIAFTDIAGYEFYRSGTVSVEPIGLYEQKTYKVAPFQIYNPLFIDGKLISNSLSSSVGGIHASGELINGSGLIHEADINGFSLNYQQGSAVGDINSDGNLNMVNYSYNMGDSVLVKVVDLVTGGIIAQRKIYGYIMENAPVLANADADSDLEIFISVFNGNLGGTPAKGSYVYMLKYNSGKLDIVSGFPIYSNASAYTIHSPSYLDPDNDGNKELIFNCGSKILVYRLPGPVKVTEYTLPRTIQTSLSYCDIDSDGKLEILALTESYGSYGKLFALTFNGTSLSVLSYTSGGIDLDMKPNDFYDLTPPVSFADIDDDGDVEIIALTASKLYVFNSNFTNFGNFPAALDARVTKNNSSAPATADLNGDGYLDILFMDKNYRVWCYSGADGSVLPGFPVQINDMDRNEMTSPAIADLDGDGDLEFAVGTRDGVMVVYDYKTKTSNRPVFANYRGDIYNSGLFSPLVPSAPGNVRVSVNGQDIILSWDAVPGVGYYTIYASANPYGNFVYVGETAGTDYTVYNMTEGRKFFYIKAVR